MHDAPTKLTPYDPTEAMRFAAKRIDPALTQEQIRALWSAMWSASDHPDAVKVEHLGTATPCASGNEESQPIRVAHITFDGSTLIVPVAEMADHIEDDEGHTYAIRFGTMTKAELQALPDFNGW